MDCSLILEDSFDNLASKKIYEQFLVDKERWQNLYNEECKILAENDILYDWLVNILLLLLF